MEDAVLTFNLTVNETNIVLSALGEMPAKTSIGVIQNIKEQAEPQVAQLNPPAEIVEEK